MEFKLICSDNGFEYIPYKEQLPNGKYKIVYMDKRGDKYDLSEAQYQGWKFIGYDDDKE